MTPEQFLELKEKVETLQSESDRAAGASSECRKRLEKEFGCSTLKEAKRLHAKQKSEIEELESKFQEELDGIEQEIE